VTFDAQGNLFGTTSYWSGNVYELISSGDTWQQITLHEFGGNRHDGDTPLAKVMFDPDGNLYGTTYAGGAGAHGGTVFQLAPTGTAWTETVLCDSDCMEDSGPENEVALDNAGHIFAAASGNVTIGDLGSVFELAPHPSGGWKHRVLLHFLDGPEGRHPQSALAIDQQHNLFGMTLSGGTYGGGVIFELSPVGGGQWTETTIYDFPAVFGGTIGGLTFDSAGTLFGAAHGQIFELRLSGNTWSYRTLYTFGTREGGWLSRLTIDKDGNLYGTARIGGKPGCANGAGCGSVFKLTKTGNHWVKSAIYEFTGRDDGGNPVGGVILDEAGNLYGATNAGGLRNCDGLTCGVVYKITP
jgi:uncharacterized repeat protein (TIGR03803 family)